MRKSPTAAHLVLAPVLREGVTNILRHSTATCCTVEAAACDSVLRLAVGNDGVTGQTAAPGRANGPDAVGGRGLANLTARLAAAGGHLATWQADGRFELVAEIPLPVTADVALRPGPGAST